jgi:tetratricopeptide (TPR) repeat protein
VQPVLVGADAKLAGRASDAPRAWAEAALVAAPPDALVLARSDSLAAALFWLTLVEPVRPDVAGIVRQHAWDVRRSRAVLGTPAAAADVAGLVRGARAARRAVVWELADDPAPPMLPGVPVGWIGAPGLPLAAQARLAERAFAPPATDDQGGAEAAARAFMNLGAFLSRAGEMPLAAIYTRRAVELGDDPVAELNLARYLLALHDDAHARRYAEVAAARLPGRAEPQSILGVIDARAGKCDDARARFARALAIDPTDRDATANLARMGQCKAR